MFWEFLGLRGLFEEGFLCLLLDIGLLLDLGLLFDLGLVEEGIDLLLEDGIDLLLEVGTDPLLEGTDLPDTTLGLEAGFHEGGGMEGTGRVATHASKEGSCTTTSLEGETTFTILRFLKTSFLRTPPCSRSGLGCLSGAGDCLYLVWMWERFLLV